MTTTYKINQFENMYCINKFIGGDQVASIPPLTGNADYNEYLEHISNGGSTTGTVPQFIQDDATRWLFDKQTNDYVGAVERLKLDAIIEPEKIDVTTVDQSGAQTTETIDNPLVTRDKEKRAAAQKTIDDTPQAVIDSLNN